MIDLGKRRISVGTERPEVQKIESLVERLYLVISKAHLHTNLCPILHQQSNNMDVAVRRGVALQVHDIAWRGTKGGGSESAACSW